MIYEKEIKCEACRVTTEIEDQMYYMLSAIMKRECEIFKDKGVKSEQMGHLPVKVTIKIEEI